MSDETVSDETGHYETGHDEAPWWTSATVYQVYPRSFADSDGDGFGDLPGVLSKVDYLQELGVDVVWLSPVYESPQVDNGYDISDYEAIDPRFGTEEDLDKLIEALHERGMKLVMDLVVNHTSDQHAWFVESRSSTDNPKRDWYWWRPPREGHAPGEPGAEPTNWGSAFSGSAWALDPTTDEYYLHIFAPEQPDLNWENPEVRREIHAMMNRWMDRGIDGFRMDVINLISKRTPIGDGPVGDESDRPPGPIDPRWGDPGDYILNGPRIHEFLHEMYVEVFEGREGHLTVGETPGASVADARLYTDPARGEVDMVFQFEHVDLDSGPGGKWDVVELGLPTLKKNLASWQEGLADAGWNSLYWDNHDQPRAVSRFGDDSPEHRVASAKALATVLHLHRGTPYVYQGQELGMTNVPFDSIDDFRDLESLNHYRHAVDDGRDPEDVLAALRAKSRDNARTPMQWDASEHAGFTAGEPWLPVNPNHREVNAAAQVGDPDSVWSHYRRLIALRKADRTVQLGTFELLHPDHPALWAFTRVLGGDELLVLANCSSQPLEVPPVEGFEEPTLVLGNLTRDGEPLPTRAPERLEPWEAVVLRRTAQGD